MCFLQIEKNRNNQNNKNNSFIKNQNSNVINNKTIVPWYPNLTDKKIPEPEPYHNLFGNDPPLNSNGDSESSSNSEIEPSMETLDKGEKEIKVPSENQNTPIKLEPNYYSDTGYTPETQNPDHKFAVRETVINSNGDFESSPDNEHIPEETHVERQKKPIKLDPIYYSDTKYTPETQDSNHKFAVKKSEPNYYSDDKFGYTYTKGSNTKRLIKEIVTSKPLFSKDTVKVSDINQKGMGDCWILSVLGSIATVNPGLIKGRIEEKDKKVSIKFNADNKQEITITVYKSIFKDNKGNDIMSTNPEGNVWVQMFEKALAAFQNKDKATIDYGSINIGNPEDAFKLFYDKTDREDIVIPNKQKYLDRIYSKKYSTRQLETYKKIESALKNHIPVVYNIYRIPTKFSNGTKSGINGEPVKAGLAEKHCYSVIGVGDEDGRKYIKIRNPWGNSGVKYMYTGKKYIPVPEGNNTTGESELDLNHMFAIKGSILMPNVTNTDNTLKDGNINKISNEDESVTELPTKNSSINKDLNLEQDDIISIIPGTYELKQPIIKKYNIPQSSEVECDFIKNGVVTLGKTKETIDKQYVNGIKKLLICWDEPLKIEVCDGVKTIDEKAFFDFESITEINLPKSIQSLGENAFNNCISLKKVTFQGEIQHLGNGIFSGCNNLTSITIPSNNIEHYFDILIRCPALEQLGLNGDEITMPEESLKGGEEKFFKLDKVEQVDIIGKSVNIQKNALKDYKLKMLTIPYNQNNVIDKETFKHTKNIEINEPTIKEYTNLNEIVIPNYVTKIGDRAFIRCNVETIKLNNGITKIGNYAFGQCTNIKQIDIPNSVKIIDTGAFAFCKNLQKVNLQKGLERISTIAFGNCSNLQQITIPSSVKIIDNGAFIRCTDLKTVTINKGLEKINSFTFDGCTSLEEITIPSSVTKIESSAFANCKNLKTVNIKGVPGNINIDKDAFKGSPSVEITYTKKSNK